ncbi:MAG: helix-turn-helix domain-containing protein [Candidatus Zambryskibacteria bacterium]|nr:helix-turn-helix domain-containing protein [Candidatus Zambryskibacteria bacterium]
MPSTHSTKSVEPFVFVSNLLPLLRERGKTQKDLALKTGLTKARISRLANQRIVQAIVTRTAIKICAALSDWPRINDQKRVGVRLDALFPAHPVN